MIEKWRKQNNRTATLYVAWRRHDPADDWNERSLRTTTTTPAN